jgi:hypothetical protein
MHVGYFLVIFLLKELRIYSLIYINQVNFYGLVFMLHYSFYIGNQSTPDFSNRLLDNVLCTMSEQVWAFTKMIKPYSILLLALFRMVAVLSPKYFGRWVKTPRFIMLTILIEHLICVSFMLTAKFVFQTSPGYVYCQDGYSSVLMNSWYYFIMTSTLGIILPSLSVIVIYFITKHTIDKQNDLKACRKSASSFSIILTGIQLLIRDRRSYRLSPQEILIKQMIIINLLLITSSFFYLVLNLSNLFPALTSNYIAYIYVMRVICFILQSLVPYVSLSSHPKFKFQNLKKQLNAAFKKLLRL